MTTFAEKAKPIVVCDEGSNSDAEKEPLQTDPLFEASNESEYDDLSDDVSEYIPEDDTASKKGSENTEKKENLYLIKEIINI